MNYIKKLQIVLVVFFISGCAANIKEVIHTPINVDQNVQNHSVYLDVSPAKSLSKSKDLTRSIGELEQLISKKFSVVKNKSSSNLVVNISIENFRFVSGFGRFMAGAIVGNAQLMLKIKITELSSGKVIGESFFDTQSEFSEGVFGATTSRQLEAMAMKITEYINSTSKNT